MLISIALAALCSGSGSASEASMDQRLPLQSRIYNVAVLSQPATPVVSFLDGNSRWPQNFNPSYVEASTGTAQVSGLLIRAQNCSAWTPGVCLSCNVNHTNPGPVFCGSVITFARSTGNGTFDEPYLVFSPDGTEEEMFGTEDPRIALDHATGIYHCA